MKAIKATELSIRAKALLMPNGLRLEMVEILFPQASAGLDPFVLPEGTCAEIEIVVSAQDIENYLNAKSPQGLTNFSVKIESGSITVLAVARVIIPLQVGAQGHLIFENNKLLFVLDRAEVAGAKAPESLVRDHIEKVNPLIDLTALPVMSRLKSLDLVEGSIRMSAALELTADIPRKVN